MISLIKCLVFIMFTSVALSQNFVSYFTGNQSDLDVLPAGGIFLAGGASDHDNAMRWFLNQCNGGDIVVLRASGSDGYNDYFFSDLGVSINSVESIVFNNRNASYEQVIIDKIKRAEGIFIAGGDQWNYVNYWRNSPVDSLINSMIQQKKIVIGGTSAGMAILGGIYFSAEFGTVSSSEVLSNPLNTSVAIDTTTFLKVPFLENLITDTHYDNPDRRGRHVGFLAKALTLYDRKSNGLACNEYTAVCVDSSGKARVFGEYPTYQEFAYFIQPNCTFQEINPEVAELNTPLTWNYGSKALKVYKIPGTLTGEHYFDFTDDSNFLGGTWLDWSVVNGVFSEQIGVEENCSPLLLNDLKINVRVQNPFQSNLKIETDLGIEKCKVYSLNGLKVFEIQHLNQNECFISTDHWEEGVYILSIQFVDGNTRYLKVLKEL